MRELRSMLALALIASLALFACGTTKSVIGGDKPEWVDGTAKKYPKEMYITGVGYGDNRGASEEKARAEISKVFSVKITQLTSVYNGYIGFSSSKDKNSWLTVNDVNSLTTTETNHTLEGVEIKDHWTDAKGVTYSLAVLEREPAMKSLQGKMQSLDKAIKDIMAEVEKAADKIGKLKFMSRALDKLKEREALNSQYTVLSGSGKGIDPVVDLSQFDSQLSNLLMSIKVFVDVSGQDEGKVKQALTESITRAKFVVADSADGVDIIVRGEVKGKPVLRNSNTGFQFAEFDAKIEMVNPANNTVFGSIIETRKEGAKELLDAKNVCLMRLSELIVKKFNKELYTFIIK